MLVVIYNLFVDSKLILSKFKVGQELLCSEGSRASKSLNDCADAEMVTAIAEDIALYRQSLQLCLFNSNS